MQNFVFVDATGLSPVTLASAYADTRGAFLILILVFD